MGWFADEVVEVDGCVYGVGGDGVEFGGGTGWRAGRGGVYAWRGVFVVSLMAWDLGFDTDREQEDESVRYVEFKLLLRWKMIAEGWAPRTYQRHGQELQPCVAGECNAPAAGTLSDSSKNGTITSASNTTNTDLFFALKGGLNRFGIVTSAEFYAHKQVPRVYVCYPTPPPSRTST